MRLMLYCDDITVDIVCISAFYCAATFCFVSLAYILAWSRNMSDQRHLGAIRDIQYLGQSNGVHFCHTIVSKSIIQYEEKLL